MKLLLAVFLSVSMIFNSFSVNYSGITSFIVSMFDLQEDEKLSIDNAQTFDFENWRSGTYSYTTGKYCTGSKKLCLNDYVTFGYKKYKAVVSDSSFAFAIRELDKDMNFIRKCDPMNGQTYTPSAEAKYLAIAIGNYKDSSGLSFDKYREMFAQGFYARLEPIVSAGKVESDASTEAPSTEVPPTVVPSTEETKVESIDSYEIETLNLSDFNIWKSGCYGTKTGKYATTQTKICLSKYASFKGQKYDVHVSNNEYALMIQELNENGDFIRVVYPTNSKAYTPNSSAKYLAITLYNKLSGAGLTYNKYKVLFDEGLTIKFSLTEGQASTVQPSTEVPTEAPTMVPTEVPTEPPTKEPIQVPNEKLSLYDNLLKMLCDGNSGTVDIYSYKCTQTQFNKLWLRLQTENCLEVYSYYKTQPSITTKGFYVKTVSFSNIDEGGPARIVIGRKKLNVFLSKVDAKMTDLDKVLWAHDFIVDNITYKTGDLIDHCAGGPLGNGYGACDGISQAVKVLLTYVGVESTPATSYNMNHGWLMVKVDNQWYHVDATWDYNYITNRWYGKHRFMMRNDEEFLSGLDKKHYDWTCYSRPGTSSTSNRFENWFVHDVNNAMLYYDGYWYYADENTRTIVKSDVLGRDSSVLIASNGFKTKVVSIDSGVLTYSQGSVIKTVNLK